MAVFGLYCLMMLWLLFFRRIGRENADMLMNARPFDTIKRYLWVLSNSTDLNQRRFAAANLAGNVGLFVPLGIFLPIIFAKMRKFALFMLSALTIIFAVELCQYISLLGVCDVDDLLLNTAGAVFGWLIWKMTLIFTNKNAE